MPTIQEKFSRVILNEAALTENKWDIPGINEIEGITCQVAEATKSSLVLRSYAGRYGLTNSNVAFESVGAHTNLVSILVDRMLSFHHDLDTDAPIDGYTYREIMEAVRLHDLPENEFGDISDNGSFDATLKQQREKQYYQDIFNCHYQDREEKFKTNVMKLLDEMDNQSSFLGRAIYCADKTAAIMITLQYDEVGFPPSLRIDDETASTRDREEMELCDFRYHDTCRASEMWTVDWFKSRRLVDFDTTGFYTAVIIMRTLQVNDRWYHWREKDYHI